jgi:hypothetical protein
MQATSDVAMVEQAPLMEGRRMLMVIAPKGGVIKRAPDATTPAPAAAPTPRPTQAAQAPSPAPAVSAKPAGK